MSVTSTYRKSIFQTRLVNSTNDFRNKSLAHPNFQTSSNSLTHIHIQKLSQYYTIYWVSFCMIN